MRRLCLTLLCGLVAVPAALAAARATGDGVLELKAAAGMIVVNGSRGTLWGQMDSGKLVVTDPLAGDGVVFVSGAETITPGKTDNATVYWGKDLHFRVTGGKYRLAFIKASGIDLTAVGVGSAQLTGDAFVDPGDYALDNGKWNPVPVTTRTVRFGVQPTPPPNPTTP
jgi:hypothetical protein